MLENEAALQSALWQHPLATKQQFVGEGAGEAMQQIRRHAENGWTMQTAGKFAGEVGIC